MITREIRHFHLFAGLGGGARGFNRGEARVGNLQASFRCIGGVDVDAAAIADFERLAGVPGTCLDMFDREQYRAFHGQEPPHGWHEATPDDVRKAAGNERPHIVFLSAPCKGFSGLLSEKKSTSAKYQALNRLTLRGVWLMLEAWADEPPELIVFENVPRIATRGRHLLDQITGLLRSYGYAVAETTHDCGELGGLAQTRKRFLLVARHVSKVPPFLYEPVRRPLRAVGDILGRMPMPSDPIAGPMHRLPELQWRTWVRLAFVEAGSDWRSLNRLTVENGVLRDYGIVPEVAYHAGTFGVTEWEQPSCTVTGRAGVTTGRYAVADPRFPGRGEYGQYGVRNWNEPSGAVSAQSLPGGGRYSVADPRLPKSPNRQHSFFRIVEWSKGCGTVTGASHVSGGAPLVADPRPAGPLFGKYAVTQFDEATGTVIAGSTTGQGAFAVADPRPAAWRDGREHYTSGGHYGVVPWDHSCGAVVGHAKLDRGPFSVADPRIPEPREQCAVVIRSMDGTWHRPFTTLELAALQGLMDPEEHLELDGLSHSAWRERIGNAVPPPAAEAIAGVMGTTLLLAWNGETFAMGSTPIWVRPVAAALMAAQEDA
ncbi:MAG: DNA cytosine methyltransferase [Oceanidesulfovibrio sp.]